MRTMIFAHRKWIGVIAALGLGLGMLPAEAQVHRIPPGKALIYLLQGDTGQYSSLPVTANGRIVGNVRANTYLALSSGPGRVLIGVTASVAAAVRLEISTGKAYFVSQQVNAAGIPVFRLLPTTVGQQQLARYSPAPKDTTTTRPQLAASAAPPKPKAPSTRAESSAPKKPEPKPEPPRRVARDSGSIILLKAGAFTLTEDEQDWFGSTTEIDATSSSTYALEYDYLFRSQWTLGVELVSYKNDWSGPGSAEGSFTTTAFTVNGKKYFAVNNTVRPFVGIGVGSVGTDFEGDVTGSTSGAAYQLMAGAEFRFNSVGVHVEYKTLSAKTEDEDGVEVDASGQGVFAGLSIHF